MRAWLARSGVLVTCGVAFAAPVMADESITYSYDALGRLVVISAAGTANNGQSVTTSFDAARSRTNCTVSAGIRVANGSVEAPDVGVSCEYNPSVFGATFAGSTGVARNGSAWGFAGASDGDQVGYVQGTGPITPAVTGLTRGARYTVTYHKAMRPGYPVNTVTASFHGTSLGAFSPASAAFSPVTTGTFIANGTSGTLMFSGLAPTTEYTTDIDKVTDAPAAGRATSQSAPSGAGQA